MIITCHLAVEPIPIFLNAIVTNLENKEQTCLHENFVWTAHIQGRLIKTMLVSIPNVRPEAVRVADLKAKVDRKTYRLICTDRNFDEYDWSIYKTILFIQLITLAPYISFFSMRSLWKYINFKIWLSSQFVSFIPFFTKVLVFSSSVLPGISMNKKSSKFSPSGEILLFLVARILWNFFARILRHVYVYKFRSAQRRVAAMFAFELKTDWANCAHSVWLSIVYSHTRKW